MKPILLVSAIFVAAHVATGADTLSIERAHALPDYTKLSLATNQPGSLFNNFIQTLGLGDFNGDGRLDIAATLGPPAHAGVSIQLQGADGRLTRSAEYAFPNLIQPAPVWDYVMSDFNEDGYLDFIAGATGNDLMMFRGHGDGTFDAPYLMGLAAPGFFVAADLNGDDHLDLVAGKLDGTVGVFLGSGDSTFLPHATLPGSIKASHPRWGEILVKDVNRDEWLDVVVAAATSVAGNGTLDVHLGNGDGTFQPVIQTAGVAVWRGALGDFNGDGILDFAGNRKSPHWLEIWIGKGDGQFYKRTEYPLGNFGNGPDAVQTADLNGDGIADIAVSGQTVVGAPFAPLSIFGGKGDGTFQQRQEFTPLDGAYIYNAGPRFADFNGDGRLDIVSLAIFWRTTPTTNFGPYVLAVALNPGVKRDPIGNFMVKVAQTGVPGTNAVILDATTDLINWTPIATNAPAGEWRLVDTSSGSTPRRFYRVRRE